MPEITVKPSTTPSDISHNSPVEGMIEPSLITFFSLDPGSVTSDEKKMLADVSRYVQGKEPFEAIDELRNIRFRLGTPKIGNTPLQHLHKYLKIRGSIMEQESQLKAMEE